MVKFPGCYQGGGTPCFLETLEKVELSALYRSILIKRYIPMIRGLEKRCYRIAIFFHIGRLIVTVGSLIVPALLSIQYTSTGDQTSNYMNPNDMAYRIFWTAWVLSLLVTTSNGILGLFKMDKKYYFLHTNLEQLRSEGWQYLQLSGRFSGFYTPGIKPTHENQFIYFCNSVEKIKMKQVQEEYYKLIDGNAHLPSIGKTSDGTETKDKLSLDSLIPPTPLKSLMDQASKIPPELLKQLLPYLSTGVGKPKDKIIHPESPDTIVIIDDIISKKKEGSNSSELNAKSLLNVGRDGEAEMSMSSIMQEGNSEGRDVLRTTQKELSS
jgi:hypothetical protein